MLLILHRPCRLEPALSRPTQLLSDRPGCTGARAGILVVEDTTDVRLLLAELLAETGADVVVAADAEAAIALAHAQPPAMLVTDLLLPGMGGEDLARTLRSICPEVLPVLFLSGLGDEPRDLDGTYVPKPFEPMALIDLASAMLAGRSG